MKFAIEVHPYEDETLTSWIIRNAIANGSDPRSFAIATLKKTAHGIEILIDIFPMIK
jgi:hypothetical protein